MSANSSAKRRPPSRAPDAVSSYLGVSPTSPLTAWTHPAAAIRPSSGSISCADRPTQRERSDARTACASRSPRSQYMTCRISSIAARTPIRGSPGAGGGTIDFLPDYVPGCQHLPHPPRGLGHGGADGVAEASAQLVAGRLAAHDPDLARQNAQRRRHVQYALGVCLVQINGLATPERRRVGLEDEHGARLGPPVEGVEDDQRVVAVEQMLHQAYAGDAALEETDAV